MLARSGMTRKTSMRMWRISRPFLIIACFFENVSYRYESFQTHRKHVRSVLCDFELEFEKFI